MTDAQKLKISEANKARHKKNREEKAAKAALESKPADVIDTQMKEMEVSSKEEGNVERIINFAIQIAHNPNMNNRKKD